MLIVSHLSKKGNIIFLIFRRKIRCLSVWTHARRETQRSITLWTLRDSCPVFQLITLLMRGTSERMR
ncbi:MAG: hypothetical protein FWH37_00725 [Candidatus Bathyarchaeota archaeon]|nr:hypothetical protein [Candidatus Termiticorpusculum sp.]